MAENLQETRKLDFRDFTLCSSMGALCYLIAITLGSGSFHDMMYDWVGVIVQLLLQQTLAFMTGGFLIYLTEYASDKLNLGPPKNFELSWLKKHRWWILKAAVTLLVIAIVIQLIQLVLQARPQRFVNDLTILLALFSGICGSIFIMAHMFCEIMKEPRTWAFMIVFGFVASMIWLNAYRDAQKSALIADSEYCHWLGRTSAERLVWLKGAGHYPAPNQKLKRAGVTPQLARQLATYRCPWLCRTTHVDHHVRLRHLVLQSAVDWNGRASSRHWSSAAAYRCWLCVTSRERSWPNTTPTSPPTPASGCTHMT